MDDKGDMLVSVHQPQMVYDTLHPTVGIIERVYEAPEQAYDVTLIASTDRASFHDPRVCFTAQGHNIVNEEAVTIHTATRGDIPATFAQMKSEGNSDEVAVFFYRGPHGFHGTTMSLKWSLFWDQLLGRGNRDGVFYRFVAIRDTDRERLLRFIGLYMDEAGKLSGGYF